MIKAIIFDADGVVIVPKRFSEEIEKDFGIPTERLTPFFEKEFKDCLVGKADLREELGKNLDRWGWNGSVEEIVEYWFRVCSEKDKDMEAEIVKLKDKGIKIFLATNQEKYRAEYIRKEMGFDELFDGIWSSGEMGIKKPDRVFFEKVYADIFGDIGADKGEIMFWDDRQANVGAGREFGFESFFFKDVDDFRRIVSEHIKE